MERFDEMLKAMAEKEECIVPEGFDKRMQDVLDDLPPKAVKRGLGAVKGILIAAAVCAALLCTAMAAYNIVRQSVTINPAQTVQGILGNGRPSWERTEIYDELGRLTYWPKRETVQVDAAQAQALLGDYLPESGYRWQIEDYTLTVEGYVLDEYTGTAKFYYTLEHPGGFGDGAVDWELGLLNYTVYRGSVTFTTQSDADWPWISGRCYVDVSRSTEEKLCIVESAASLGGWKAEDGLRVKFTVHGETDRDDDVLSADLELPGLKSLPTVSVPDPATRETVLELSAISLMLKTEDMDLVDYIALDYADGTRYVVRDDANGLDNTDYGLGSGSRPNMILREVFNRLVNPSQVVGIHVDGKYYPVK